MKPIATMGDTTNRAAYKRAALDVAIVALALALVWLFKFKSVACSISGPTGCSADARLVPALIASVALILLLVIALAIVFLAPVERGTNLGRGVSLVLAVAGLVASLLVLFSAGFIVWPIWA